MSTQTTNFGLNKDEGNNWYDVNKVNTNTDIIDTALGNTAKFEKAGGTATAITVTGVTIADGRSKTFIVKANNNGTATTINGKPLYKPGTTSAPSLTTGKAVTVWYDLTGDCFFIKASAEGDAVAANVLAGKKFSNDNDTGITGTMTNNGTVTITPGTADQVITAGYHNGSGKVVGDADLVSANIKAGVDIFGVVGKTSVVDTADANAVAGNMLSGKTGYVNGTKVTGTITSKVAATITPSTTDQTIAAGQYLSGAQTIKGDVNLVAAKIEKGTTIFNVAGTLDTRQLNFPLTIQDTTPTPVRAGHIWVKSATLASQITKVKILEAVNAGETDGTLMLVVGDLALHSISFANTIDTNGGAKQVSIADTISSTADWEIISKAGDSVSSLKINRPLVYSKVGGVLDIETAYIWNGLSWVQLTQKGSYFIGISSHSSGSGVASIVNVASESDTYTLGQTITGLSGHSQNSCSADGTYLLLGMKVFKRVGDVYSEYFTIPSDAAYPINYIQSMSKNGQAIVVSRYYNNGSANICKISVYEQNGTTYVEKVLETGIYGACNTKINADGTLILAAPYGTIDRHYWKTSGTWGKVAHDSTSIPNFTFFEWGHDNSYIIANSYDGSFSALYRIDINYLNKVLTKGIKYDTRNSNETHAVLGVHPAGVIFYQETDYNGNITMYCKRASDGEIITRSGYSQTSYNITFNLNGTRMVYSYASSIYTYSCVYDETNKKITFTLLGNKLSDINHYYGRYFVPY